MTAERPDLETPQPVRYDHDLQAWIVSRREHAEAVLRDHARFSNNLSLRSKLPREVLEILRTGRPIPPSVGAIDPPHHTHHRKVLNVALTPTRVEALEPKIQEIAEQLIDAVYARGAVDLKVTYTDELPTLVFGLMTSQSPAEMRELMELRRSWNKLAYSPSDIDAERHSARQILELQRRFFQVVEARRREPKDDVLSVMCAACLDGERPISTAQLVAELMGLLEAGQETVSALIANTIYHVLYSTSLWPKLATDDKMLAASINETLRYCSGIRGVYRRATDDVELDQVTIHEGSKVLVMLAALGKDPEQLEDPDSYNPTRGSCPHMAFGRGIHFCIGGPIAKAQAKVALRTLSRRIPDLTLGSDFVYDTYGHPAFQIPRALHVVWQPRLIATG